MSKWREAEEQERERKSRAEFEGKLQHILRQEEERRSDVREELERKQKSLSEDEMSRLRWLEEVERDQWERDVDRFVDAETKRRQEWTDSREERFHESYHEHDTRDREADRDDER